MRYWLVRGSPRGNDFGSFVLRGNADNWRTKRPPRDWEAGDRTFFWASSPQLELIGLGKLLTTGRRTRAGDHLYRVAYLTGVLEQRPPIDELRADPIVSGAIFLKNGPAMSVTRLRTE